jgi:lipopolysaccharide export LptBFGC system permease protein LptF
MAPEQWTDQMLNELAELTKRNAQAIDKLTDDIDKQRQESKELTLKFQYYQQASQWVVNLAFGLLATATITTIITAVLRK